MMTLAKPLRMLLGAVLPLGVTGAAMGGVPSIDWFTVDGGGAMFTTGGSLELSGTIGQPDAGGPMTGGSFELNGGFWYPATVSCAAPGFVPGAAGVSVADVMFNEYIDPRAESTDGMNDNLGLDEITVKFTIPLENSDGTPLSADRFSINDTAGTPPTITGISTPDGQTVTVLLDDEITVQAWTRLTVSNVRSTCDHAPFTGSLVFGFLPGDIDQDRMVGPFDLLRFRQYVNNVSSPPLGVKEDYVDIDRDGAIGPFDLLAYRRLVNGVSPATQPWANETLPPPP